MKKLKRLVKIKKFRTRGKADEQAGEGVPRITNETVAAHREEVLSSARKYIYPLQHSKHRIILITTGLLIVAIVAFFSYTTLALYKLQSSSTFLYKVTQVIPFPIARTSGKFIAYENYLFELRHYTHYYETQQKLDFDSEAGRQQLAEFRQRALDKVINDAYVGMLAKQNNITVSDKEVNAEIELVRNQNRLGGSDRVFEDVLKDYWGWSLDDFKRSLKQQLLAQKVAATLDTETTERANAAMAELQAGADFGATAKKYSDDPASKDNNGDFGIQVDKTNRDLSAQTTTELFKLGVGQTSGVINIGYALEIIKSIENTGDKARGAHILFNFKDISGYVNDLKEKQPYKLYLKLPPADSADQTEPTF